MNTIRFTFGLAAATLAVGALPLAAAADASRTNPLHPAYYQQRFSENQWVATKARPTAQDEAVRNPLTPAYYQGKVGEGHWVATRAVLSARDDAIRNPLHPQHYVR